MRVYHLKSVTVLLVIKSLVLGVVCGVLYCHFKDRFSMSALSERPVSSERMKYDGVIPRRLHQTYKEEMVPVQYRPFIESWLANQRDWEIYFWTDEEAMTMIRERYPEYVSLMEGYGHGLMRSDAIRYFILHQYGGVYADLDMVSLRPLEPLLQSESCVLSREPEVQTRLLFSMPWSLTNCIMACTAHHPFFTHLLKGLEKSKRPYKENTDVLHATGPFFVNQSYTAYRDAYTQCRGAGYCGVTVAEGKYLVPVPDMERLRDGRRECLSPSLTARFTPLQQDACRRLKNLNTGNSTPPPDAYTDHRWTHVGWFPQKVHEKVSIMDIVPKARRYGKTTP